MRLLTSSPTCTPREIPCRISRIGGDILLTMSANETASDVELLQRYSRNRSEDAFAELVRRHVNLVYSAALRQVRSPQLAQEVSQCAFADLACNANKLKPDTILTAWLYQVTRRTAVDVVRRESRRQAREQVAIEMNAMNATTADWAHIEPLLDEAVSALDETDRAAILLRYFENKPLREVGDQLGISDDAAQKRVSRAVERLRGFFTKRGVTVGAGGLVVVISANAVQAAPVGLAVTISTAAVLSGAALAATTATVTATKAIAMTTLQKALVAGTVIAASVTTPLVIQHHARVKLSEENQSLRRQLEQLPILEAENERLANLVAQEANTRSLSDDQFNELLRLRGEVGMLRQMTNELGSLRAENQKLRSATPPTSNLESAVSPSASVGLGYYARDSLFFAGYGEPENAFMSIVWAASRGDFEVMLNGMTPETRAPIEKEFQNMSDERFAEVKTRMDKLAGHRILKKQVLADDMVSLDVASVNSDGNEAKESVWFKRIGSEWKLYSPR